MSLLAEKLPPLEKETLGRVLRGEDPWNGFRGSAGVSGRYSQAVNRLIAKGYVGKLWDEDGHQYEYVATETGRKVYAEER